MAIITIQDIDDLYYQDENGKFHPKEGTKHIVDDAIAYEQSTCPFCHSTPSEQHGIYHNGLCYAPCPNAVY